MESVTSHSKIFQALCGNNAFQQSETDVKIYRFPSGEFLQLNYQKAEEFLRFLKLHERKNDGYFSRHCIRSSILISEEICHEPVVTLSVVLLSYTSRVRQHWGAAVALQLNSQTGK